MKDKVIRCQDCYNEFVFTAEQQKAYPKSGWIPPVRCPQCRARRKKVACNATIQGATLRMYSRHGRGYFRKMGN